MRPEAQPASAKNNPIVTMRRMIANPLNFPGWNSTKTTAICTENRATKKGRHFNRGALFRKNPAITPG
jgi:hypothetical protein